jgi:hypothetical protein
LVFLLSTERVLVFACVNRTNMLLSQATAAFTTLNIAVLAPMPSA